MWVREHEEAIRLRTKDQLGYGEIAKRLGVPKSTLSYWLKDLPLSAERVRELRQAAWSRGEASREAFRKTMRAKRDAVEKEQYAAILKRFTALSRQSLHVAGLMLYHAEGDKRDSYHIGLANTDPQVISFFIWWLGAFLGVSKDRVRLQLHLYESMDIEAQQRFWKRHTGVSTAQFYKTQVRKLRPGSFSYPESSRHGTCKMYVQGKKETTELLLSIRAFFDTYRGTDFSGT